MSRYAIGDIHFLHKMEDERNMLDDTYYVINSDDEDYYLNITEVCVCCSREIYANEICKTCDQCIGFQNGCCTCKTGGQNE